jgi:hypothetical protein
MGVAHHAKISRHSDFDKAVQAMHSKLVLKVPSGSHAKQTAYKNMAADVRSAISKDYEDFASTYSQPLSLLTSFSRLGTSIDYTMPCFFTRYAPTSLS